MRKTGLNRLLVVAIGMSLLTSISAVAADSVEGRGGFLTRGADPRGVALGGASVAGADDASASWSNPGALTRVGALNALAAYDLVGAGVTISHLAAAMPAGPGSVGVGLSLVGYGSYDTYDAAGNKTGSESLSDLALVAGYAMANPDWLGGRGSTGVSLEMLHEGVGGSLFGLSLGGIVPAADALDAGWAIQHIGPAVDGGRLPSIARIGLAYRGLPNLTGLAEVGLPFVDQLVYGAVGVEVTPTPTTALRIGYKAQQNQGLTGLTGFTAGLGFTLGKVGIDYAYQPFGDLPTSHRVSLSYGRSTATH